MDATNTNTPRDVAQALILIDDATTAIDEAVRLLRRAGLVALSREVATAAVQLRANAHDVAVQLGGQP